MQCVETLLHNQLTNAIKPQYLNTVHDRNDMISLPIHSILNYLICTHGRVSKEQYMEMERKSKEMVYDLSLPVDIVFNKIDFC